MNSHYCLQYYHSFNSCDSAQATFCCNLQDGGILIAQSVEDGIDYVIHKDGEERAFRVPIGWSFLSLKSRVQTNET